VGGLGGAPSATQVVSNAGGTQDEEEEEREVNELEIDLGDEFEEEIDNMAGWDDED
jgi:transcription initiation factor TFIID subunit TAF12